MTTTNRDKNIKSMHHIVTNPFQNCVRFPTKRIFKIALQSFGGKSTFFNKSNSISRKMISKLLERSSLFQKKAVLVPFSTWFDFKSYLLNSLKTSLLSKGVTISLSKNKRFVFQSTKYFQTKDHLAQFCFKTLWFHPTLP